MCAYVRDSVHWNWKQKNFLLCSNGDFPSSSEGDEQDAIYEWECYAASGHYRTYVEVIFIQDADSGSKEREENKHLCHIDVVLLVRLDVAEHTETENNQQTVDELKQRRERRESRIGHKF